MPITRALFRKQTACYSKILIVTHSKQEYIPVGCIPPAHWPYLIAIHTPPPHTPPCHACPHACHLHACHLLCTPPATHPLPCMPHPFCHAHPLPCMPPAIHAPLPCMPPRHACPHHTHTHPWTPPATHTPCHACPPPPGQNSWHTLLKILPCPNFIAGGNNQIYYDNASVHTTLS